MNLDFNLLLEQFNVYTVIENLGYVGVFVVSFFTSATILFPIPGIIAIPFAAHFLHPLLVALVGALGAALGEVVAYGVGRAGRLVAERKGKEVGAWMQRLAKWFERFNGFLVIVLFSATPLPDDVIAIFCGSIKYSIRKFFVATFLGRFLMFLVLAYGLSFR